MRTPRLRLLPPPPAAVPAVGRRAPRAARAAPAPDTNAAPSPSSPPPPIAPPADAEPPLVLPRLAVAPSVPHTPADITARREFWGKLSVLSLVAALLGERVTGKGVVQALDLAVGVPMWELDPILALPVGGLLLAAFTPPRSLAGVPPAALIRGGLYRLAHAALAAAIVTEAVAGQGVLALLELETGVGQVSEIEAVAVFFGLLFVTGSSSASGGGGERKE